MSDNVIKSLKELLDTSGDFYKGKEAETKERNKIFEGLVKRTIPEKFAKTNNHGYTNPPGKRGQTIKNWFWIEGFVNTTSPVSLSTFLLKDKNKAPIIRLSVEIRFNIKERGKNKVDKAGTIQNYFDKRPTYANALKLSLSDGLSYWYNGTKNSEYFDKKIVNSFLKNPEDTSHVEIAKVIDLSKISTDHELEKEMENGYQSLFPYYEVASGAKSIENILKEYPKLSLLENENKNEKGPAFVQNEEKIKEENFKISKNLILFGPPGTGKTYHSIAYAEAVAKKDKKLVEQLIKHQNIANYEILKNNFRNDLVEYDSNGKVKNGHICFTTFHQSYSYEDFIEGIFPDVDQATGSIRYILKPGVFKSLCDYAAKTPNENFVIVIDEINRGNVSKIFGDLITLIEEDKRILEESELTVTLPYSKEKWGVPNNVYIIGTMNTADRSIERLDTALRRRFEFIEMMPNASLLSSYQNCLISEPDNITPLSLSDILLAINERISYVYDRDHQIGHSYFLEVPNSISSFYKLSDLAEVFKNKIVPLLQEYFYDNYQKIRFVLGITGKEYNDQNFIIRKKPKLTYVSQNKDLLDDIDDEEEEYEINYNGYNDINNYFKIVGREIKQNKSAGSFDSMEGYED